MDLFESNLKVILHFWCQNLSEFFFCFKPQIGKTIIIVVNISFYRSVRPSVHHTYCLNNSIFYTVFKVTVVTVPTLL